MRLLILAAFVLPPMAISSPLIYTGLNAGVSIVAPSTGLDWGRPLGAGDFDNDGFDDLVVANTQGSAGLVSQVFIVRGRPELSSLGSIDLSVVPADQVISGEVDDNLGASVAVGDVNGDLIEDLIIVASQADFMFVADRGVAYVIFGGTNFFDSTIRDLTVPGHWDLRLVGPVPSGDMGGSTFFGGEDAQAAAVGDINNDNIGDIILGVHLADASKDAAGRVYVRFGGQDPSGTTLRLDQQNDRDVEIWGQGEFDQLGTAITTGDITGDGIQDLILGNPSANRAVFTSEGAVYVFRGRQNWPSAINLANSAADITIIGARRNDFVGQSVATGDFNGDNFTDLAIGAPGVELGQIVTFDGDGIVYLFCGGPALASGTLSYDLLVDQADAEWRGEPQQQLGELLVAANLNQDLFDDLVASQPFGGPAQTTGVVDVLFGKAFARPAQFNTAIDSGIRIFGSTDEQIGNWIGTADLNGDAQIELLISAPERGSIPATVYAWYITGDVDFDKDVDLADIAVYQACVDASGANALAAGCALLDYTLDGLVTASDWLTLERVNHGPNAD